LLSLFPLEKVFNNKRRENIFKRAESWEQRKQRLE